MSGPSLRRQDAHSSIHEAALNEARDLRSVFQKCLLDGEKEKALHVAEITIEHWESRTLKHADAEEEGLYREMAEESPELLNVVTQLTRDHDLMRRMVNQLKGLLAKGEIDERMLSYMDSLLIIDSIHNDDEMNNLLGHEAS
ncbi:hemerythrin domain-containing protein [Neobacillus muris]|uniref:hemerythrin domain-containing protein n=1 Tax=Neobacillus muris TaxID=2941334 RepID=UPI0020417E54|nr:hemerythrin domain-containing protein [Neobacillus muris]